VNRERLLLVAVLALVALWFVLLREKPQVRGEGDVGPRILKVEPRPVLSAASERRTFKTPETGAFTLKTNELPYPRPLLARPGVVRPEGLPKAYDLPNLWPPTSRSVSIDRLGMLRRPAAAPQDGESVLALPDVPAEAGAAAAGAAVERLDTWMSFKARARGRVRELIIGGQRVAEPREAPAPGKEAAESPFFRNLCLLDVDPGRAREAGVTAVRAQLEGAGTFRQSFDDEIHDFRICVEGRQKGLINGLKEYLRLPAEGYQARLETGRRLLERGVSQSELALVRWALFILNEAREQVPAAGAQQALRKILLLMLEAANRLNEQEFVLQLAFEHLSQFREEEEVLEYVGNILASRSFGLPEMAEEFFELAANSPYAQRRRVEVLSETGRFAEARALLTSGRAGGGAAVDLLLARVALAQGDLETARSAAMRHTSGETAADAYQILGGIAYVAGDAAQAEESFLNAVTADPGRSTAYSDLGLALAVQGKSADALECFARAAKLDPIDNPITPRLGSAFLKLSAGKVTEGVEDLNTLHEDNPRDLLVRFLLGYAHERSANLDEAARLYRSTLDEDHRYRVAIARLGVVQAQRVEEGADPELVKEAVAHLGKAVALNPQDAVLPYLLGRFLMRSDPQLLARHNIGTKLADTMFTRAQTLKAPAGNDNLPLWAQLTRACLLYRDAGVEERRVKAQLVNLQNRIQDLLPPGTPEKEALEHEVYAAAEECLEIVKETELKVNKTWDFRTRPRDWEFFSVEPMLVNITRGRLRFMGTVDYQGAGPNFLNVMKHCAVKYESKVELLGKNFYELVVEGHVPDGSLVDLGIGLVNPGRGRSRAPAGIQVRRKSRTGTAEVRLDGGEHQVFKQVKTRQYVDMNQVPWPAGDFRLHIKVERGKSARQQGRFKLMLNDISVFEKQLGTESERSASFGRGRSNQVLQIYLWVEGNEGLEIPEIYVTKVVLTKAKK
jgi:tetratricopeptide (TPR) repeat protein